jgi:hypothetical protein
MQVPDAVILKSFLEERVYYRRHDVKGSEGTAGELTGDGVLSFAEAYKAGGVVFNRRSEPASQYATENEKVL